jgi:hypothetical protein
VWRLTPARHARIFKILVKQQSVIAPSNPGFPTKWTSQLVHNVYAANTTDVPDYFQDMSLMMNVGLSRTNFSCECLRNVIKHVAPHPIPRLEQLANFDSDLYKIYFEDMKSMARGGSPLGERAATKLRKK